MAVGDFSDTTTTAAPSTAEPIEDDVGVGLGVIQLVQTPDGLPVLLDNDGDDLYVVAGTEDARITHHYVLTTGSDPALQDIQTLDAQATIAPPPGSFVARRQETYDWRLAMAVDRDWDAVSDAKEAVLGSDPLDRDSDDDGIADADEIRFDQDDDGDNFAT